MTVALNENVRLRCLIDAENNPSGYAFTLRYKLSVDSVYQPVLVGAALSAPTWVANGAQTINAAAITPALPAGIQAGDYLVTFVETANQATSIANGNGATWTEIGSQVGTGTGGGTGATRISLWGTFYDGVITTGPTTNDSGDHQLGFVAAFRGVHPTSPVNVAATFSTEAGPTTVNIPGAVTTVDNCLVVAAVADDWDNASTSRYGSWTNSNLTGLTERFDFGSTTQNGGGLGMATGVMATAGNYGTTTASANASITVNANASFALNPAPRPVYVATSSNITGGGEVTTAQLTPPSGKSTSDFTVGRMWDDENGTDSVDIAEDFYTELEWCLRFQAPAEEGDEYQFRVYAGGAALDTYDVTPAVEIGGGGGGATDLDVDDLTVAAVADAPTLTQVHQLAVADLAVTVAADVPTLTQAHTLVVADAAVAVTADTVTLTQVHVLAVSDLTVAAAADTPTLAQAHQLAVADLAVAVAADVPTLTQVHSLAVTDATIETTADTVTLDVGAITLGVSDLTVAAVADAPTLTQVHELVVADATVTTTADTVTLDVGAITLDVDDLAVTTTADTVTLTQVHTLVVADAVVATTIDTVALTQVHELVVADLAIEVVIDTPTIVVGGITLVVADLAVGATIDLVSLTQTHVLSVDDLTVTTTADTVTLTQAHVLAVSDLAVTVVMDSVTLTEGDPGPFPVGRITVTVTTVDATVTVATVQPAVTVTPIGAP